MVLEDLLLIHAFGPWVSDGDRKSLVCLNFLEKATQTCLSLSLLLLVFLSSFKGFDLDKQKNFRR